MNTIGLLLVYIDHCFFCEFATSLNWYHYYALIGRVGVQDRSLTIGIIWITVLFGILALSLWIRLLKQQKIMLQEKQKYFHLEQLFKEALKLKEQKNNNQQFMHRIAIQLLGMIRLVIHFDLKKNQKLTERILNLGNKENATESLLNWDDIFLFIDILFDDFYTKLAINYGDRLGDKEIQQCCLLCAKFSIIEISYLMQQSIQTIYQRNSTVRNKLNISEKENITYFLHTQTKI